MTPEEARTLLLVDDEPVFLERMARAFESRGFAVRKARGYEEAIAAAKDDPPEFAVVDLRMPGPSGLEVVRALHELDAATSIVVLTGYGSIATAVEAMRLGAADYLSKPVGIEDLLIAFARLEHRDSSRPAPELRAPSLARAEWEHMQRVISDCGGNISEAARRLGMHRRSLQRKLQKHPPRE